MWRAALLSVNLVSHKYATKILHYQMTGSWPNLASPENFNEKLQWIKLNEKDEVKAKLADKYLAHFYVRDKCGKELVNKIYGVYDRPEEIEWDKLPDAIAIKCNHGCGYNIITKDKKSLDKRDVEKKLNYWLKEKFGRRSLEYYYDKITPKIIIENYIEDSYGLLPRDYKFYCFNGVPKIVLVCSERSDSLKLDFFDLSWNRINVGLKENESEKEIEKPSCLNEMIKNAELLSKGFRFVRIDFYDKDGNVIFGEFTFTPGANMANYYSEYGIKYLGDMLDIASNDPYS